MHPTLSANDQRTNRGRMTKSKVSQVQVAPERRKRRSPEEIMARLLRAASDEFRRAGYAGATTAAIAREAEVTEAQLFRYFASKAELFRVSVFEPLNRSFADFNAAQLAKGAIDTRPLPQKVRSYIEELQMFIGEHAEALMSLVVAEAYEPDSIQGLGGVKALGEYFERGANEMIQRTAGGARVAPELLVRVSFTAVLANVLFRHWMFPAGMASEQQISEALTDFVIEGVSINAS